MTDANKEEINKLLQNANFVSMLRNYIDKKNKKLEGTDKKDNETTTKNDSKIEQLSNIDKIDENQESKEAPNSEKIDEKKEELDKTNQDGLNSIANDEQKEEEKEKDKDNNDTSNLEFNNFNNDVMDFNSQILNDKRTPSKNSISNLSSSGIDPRNFLGKKRQYNKFENDELTCKEIYANKNSSPSLIMLSKIVEEFTFGMVLDTLLKSNLSQNLKLDAMLQGLIDSEGINKVILMLLKFNIINIFYSIIYK